MTDIQIPFAVVASLLSGVFAFAAAWATMRGRMASLEKELAEVKANCGKRFDRLEGQVDAHAKEINSGTIALTEAATRLSDIAELKTSAVRADVFRVRMDQQDDTLNELRIALDRKQSVAAMPATMQPGLPPMRPRLPSRPAR